MIKVFQSFVCNMCTFYLKGPEMTPLKQEEYKFDKASNTSKWFKIYKIKKKVHMDIDTVNQWKIHLMTQSKMSWKRAKNILVCDDSYDSSKINEMLVTNSIFLYFSVTQTGKFHSQLDKVVLYARRGKSEL